MYSAKTGTITAYLAAMKQKCSQLSRREDDVPSSNEPTMSWVQRWHKFFSRNHLQNVWSPNNQLSVTVVNNEILQISDLLKNSSMKMEDLQYTLEETQLSYNLNQKCPKDYIEFSIPKHAPETDYMEDWDIVDDSNSIKIKTDVNLIKNSDTYEDNSTMESHSILHVNETENTMENNMTDALSSLNIDSRKCEISKDTDVESFLVVPHSNIPTVNFVTQDPVSRFSNICRNTWNNLANRLYCKTESTRMPAKRPSYLNKQHQRRRASVIAMGRGRGRAKCQLRRSGVSQTICRKEYIKYGNYKAWQKNLVGTAPNDRSSDSERHSLANINISDPTQIAKEIDIPSVFSSPKMKGKPKGRKKKKTKAKYMTKAYKAGYNSSRMNYREDSNSEIFEMTEDDLSQLQTSSEHSDDDEDDWIVFEDNDDEKLPAEKRGAIEYPTGTCMSNSWMRNNDSSYEDFNIFNSKTYDDEKVLSRWRSLSESSTNSEDNKQIAMECQKAHDRLRKVSYEYSKYVNRLMQKNSFQRRRIPSDSSETSDDANISNKSNTPNGPFANERNDDIDDYNETNLSDENNQDDSIIFADENIEELTAQIKKVSFDLTPVVHVMIKWDYAYRAARKSHWEEIARDNERFKGRVNSIAIVLDPILKSAHRSKIWQERFAFLE